MKKRVFNLLNFLALNVLFFALYLNFIHKDTNILPAVSASTSEAAKKLAAHEKKNEATAQLQTKTKTVSIAN